MRANGGVKTYFEGMGGYLRDVCKRLRYLLGGGSILIVAVGFVEHLLQRPISWTCFLIIAFACLVGGLFTVGFEKHKAALRRLRISGEVFSHAYLNPRRSPGLVYYLEVFNDSQAKSVEGVSVKLTGLEPQALRNCSLPLPLQIKHDRSQPPATEFRLDPGERRQVDVVAAAQGSPSIEIWHSVSGVAQDIPSGKYTLTVEATGQDVPAFSRKLEVWRNDKNQLQCVPL